MFIVAQIMHVWMEHDKRWDGSNWAIKEVSAFAEQGNVNFSCSGSRCSE